MVREYQVMFPKESEEISRLAKKAKLTSARVLGDDGHMELRLGIRIPGKLYDILRQTFTEPAFLKEDSEWNWFMKTFSEYTVPKVV